MRGIISPKLEDFISQANINAAAAKEQGVVLTPALVRGNLDKLKDLIGDGPELAYVQDGCLDAPTHGIPVRVYSPEPTADLPVVLHYHGGGHMCGSIDLYDAISRKIAKAGHCIVIAVEYRLAPDHPYPAGVDDCQFALAHYQQVLSAVAYNDQLIIAGDSAGGAICTTLVSQNLTNADITINKQVLIYPSVDYTLSSASVTENGSGYLLETSKVDWYFDSYFQQQQSRTQMSPLFMPMSVAMPNTLIFTGGCDPLRDEGFAYGQALKQLGVEVQEQHFPGMIHAYMLLDRLVASECEQTYQMIGNFINR